jgi:acetylornithine deacetylase/succinyl-diaminopimelate desuccinylase-like protein
MARFLDALTDALPPAVARAVRQLTTSDAGTGDAASELATVCEPAYLRAGRALLRDTFSPTMIATGVKYNVIPGVAEVIVDCRFLPDTTETAMRREVVRRLGDLARHCSVELVITAPPVEADLDVPIYGLLDQVLREHDPGAIPVPVVMPFATDAKHTVRLGVPTFGFSPLRLAPEERFLERFHGVDERVGVDALAFGLPVLHDVVRRFCG